MTPLLRLLSLVSLVLFPACGAGEGPSAEPPGDDGGMTPGGGERLDTSAAGLTAFVKSGAYKSWKAEPAVHDSAGPHGGKVRSYVNDVFYASLKAGNTEHPRGSIVVKELYGSSTTTVTGHAVDIKDEATGEWVFYEGFAPSYGTPYYYRGTSNFCANCHQRANNDYMLTPAAAFP
jgi:Cytochrome P460